MENANDLVFYAMKQQNIIFLRFSFYSLGKWKVSLRKYHVIEILLFLDPDA